MKAVLRPHYGPPAVLIISEMEQPVPGENDLLIRVHACTANRTDYHVLTGKPFYMRMFTGLFKPKTPRIGCDFAGEVISTGQQVTTFKQGDRVMGFGGVFGIGALAEYIVFAENDGVVLIPDSLSYEQAAACIEGAYYAAASLLQMKFTAGQSALVYGATGAIGSAQVQMLKYFGLSVTAVCGGEHIELVRSLGADKVIDYKTTDFTKDTEQYDFVFDAVDKVTFLQCKPLLKAKGIYISSGGIVKLIWSLLTKITGGKRVLFLVPKDIKGGMNFITDMVRQQKFKPVIDRTYSIKDIAAAFTYTGSGLKVGSVVIVMDFQF